MDEKTRLLPAVQTIYGSTSNRLKIRRCLFLLGVVTAVVLAGLTMWRLFFDEPAADEFICGRTSDFHTTVRPSHTKNGWAPIATANVSSWRLGSSIVKSRLDLALLKPIVWRIAI
jgi:hypothetical protein